MFASKLNPVSTVLKCLDLRLPFTRKAEANIVEFYARDKVGVVEAACNEHLSVGQQGGRVRITCGGEVAGGCPSPARRIVEFRAREIAAAVVTACDEHLPVGQQGGRVRITCGGEAAGGRPSPGCWIVEFRAREIAAVVTACDQHLAVG